jgi:hypothetical protein
MEAVSWQCNGEIKQRAGGKSIIENTNNAPKNKA